VLAGVALRDHLADFYAVQLLTEGSLSLLGFLHNLKPVLAISVCLAGSMTQLQMFDNRHAN
jgi:hypothetical protein